MVFITEHGHQRKDSVIGFTHNLVALALVARFHVFFDLTAHTFPVEVLRDGVDRSCGTRVA